MLTLWLKGGALEGRGEGDGRGEISLMGRNQAGVE